MMIDETVLPFKLELTDEALRAAAGLVKMPASTTLGDWLRRTGESQAAMSGLAVVQDGLTACRHKPDARTDYTLDVDTTIIEAHKQDATRCPYRKLRRPSYYWTYGSIQVFSRELLPHESGPSESNRC